MCLFLRVFVVKNKESDGEYNAKEQWTAKAVFSREMHSYFAPLSDFF